MANEVVAALVSMPANMMTIGLDTVDCGKRKGRKNWSGEMRGGLDEDSLFIIIVMLPPTISKRKRHKIFVCTAFGHTKAVVHLAQFRGW